LTLQAGARDIQDQVKEQKGYLMLGFFITVGLYDRCTLMRYVYLPLFQSAAERKTTAD